MELSNRNVLLCNRYKQIQDIEALEQGVVSDYHIHKNKIFANNTLDSKEFDKFSRIYDILTEDLEMPNMIIFLDADLDVLKTRIAKRNRDFEHTIEDDYLLKLKQDYKAYYESLKMRARMSYILTQLGKILLTIVTTIKKF